MDLNQKKQDIINYFSKNKEILREKLINLLGEMVAQRTVNVITEKMPDFPFLKHRGEEYRVGDIAVRELEKLGVKYEVFAKQKERPNIITHYGSNKKNKRLFIASHMDIVPPGDGWETDPFNMQIKNGIAYGRGVLDNKGPLVSSIIAIEILKNVLKEDEIEGDFQVAFLSDEEAHEEKDYGIGYLLEEKLINPTYAIIPDIGGNMLEIDIAEKGRVVARVIAKGKQAHGSTPERGDNAINRMARFLSRLEKHELDHGEDLILGGPTVNVGEIKGGSAPNIVPSVCEAILDIRLVKDMTPEKIIGELLGLIPEERDKIEVIIKGGTYPHSISPENELVQSIIENSKKYFNKAPKPFGSGGGTYAKKLNMCGITAVGFGPGDDNAFHMTNEYVEIEQLLDFSVLICLIALDLI